MTTDEAFFIVVVLPKSPYYRIFPYSSLNTINARETPFSSGRDVYWASINACSAYPYVNPDALNASRIASSTSLSF